MPAKTSKFVIFVITILFLSVAVLGYGSYYFYNQLNDLKSQIGMASNSGPRSTSVENSTMPAPFSDNNVRDTCGDACKEEIKNQVADEIKALNLTSTEKQTTVTTVSTKTPQTSYIPLGTTTTSTSTNWHTIEDASAFIDVLHDYGGDNAYITFEASLKVAHGNGQAFVRLWDDTNKIAVNGSEISTVNNADYELVKSGRIYLWNGNNEYKVQIKSLNGFEVTYTSGKVKLVY